MMWQARQRLIKLNSKNAKFLEIIETSLFSATFSDLSVASHEEV